MTLYQLGLWNQLSRFLVLSNTEGPHHDVHWNPSSLLFACNASNIMNWMFRFVPWTFKCFWSVLSRRESILFALSLLFSLNISTLYDCKTDIYSRSVSTCQDTKTKTGLDLCSKPSQKKKPNDSLSSVSDAESDTFLFSATY